MGGRGACGTHCRVAPDSGLRSRDPVASGNTGGREPTKGKRSRGLLRAGVGRSAPAAEGGSPSPPSLERDSEGQRGDQAGSVWSPGDRAGSVPGAWRFLTQPRRRSRLLCSFVRDLHVSAHLHWARPSGQPLCERSSCPCCERELGLPGH